MLNLKLLTDLIALGRDYGLEAVVEVFDQRDLELAQAAGAEIIQVNNRDLDLLEVDMDNSRRLVEYKQPEEFWISASGIDSARQVSDLADLGFDAVLVGSSLMNGKNPGQALMGLQHKKAVAK